MRLAYSVIYWIVYPFFNLVHPCRPVNRENVPEGAVILCPNHTRMSDPFFVVFALGRHIQPWVMAKAELMRVPVIGWLLKKAGVFAVDRGKSDVGAIKHAMKCLKNGEKLLMFPEGTIRTERWMTRERRERRCCRSARECRFCPSISRRKRNGSAGRRWSLENPIIRKQRAAGAPRRNIRPLPRT